MAGRSVDFKDVQGGIPQVLANLVSLFFGLRVFDFRTGSLQLEDDAGKRMRSSLILGWACKMGVRTSPCGTAKAAQALASCMLCLNRVAAKSRFTDEDGENLLARNTLYEKDLKFATNNDTLGACDRSMAYKISDTAKDFFLRQQASGIIARIAWFPAQSFSTRPPRFLIRPPHTEAGKYPAAGVQTFAQSAYMTAPRPARHIFPTGCMGIK